MNLIDLHPEWITHKGRHGVGFRFLCPGCLNTNLMVLFLNPLDGGLPVPDDESCPGNNNGKRWARSGMTFAEMTLSPSIDASEPQPEICQGVQLVGTVDPFTVPCGQGGKQHWHGHILHGVAAAV